MDKKRRFIFCFVWLCAILGLNGCEFYQEKNYNQIAYLKGSINDQKVMYLMDIENLTTSRLDLPKDIGCPEWSPDGNMIMFVAFHEEEKETNIYIYNIYSNKLTQVTNGGYWLRNPSWSPDGTRIAVEGIPSDGTISGGPYSIYTLNVDGSNLISLTNTSAYFEEPSWSPDENEIIAVTHPTDPQGLQIYRIISIYLDGTFGDILTDLSEPASYNEYIKFGNPVWSPDGTQIAYEVFIGGRSDIYIMNRDGTQKRNLTKSSSEFEHNFSPSWSPDGEKIAYSSNRDCNDKLQRDLFIIDVESENVTRLTDSCDSTCPNWRP